METNISKFLESASVNSRMLVTCSYKGFNCDQAIFTFFGIGKLDLFTDQGLSGRTVTARLECGHRKGSTEYDLHTTACFIAIPVEDLEKEACFKFIRRLERVKKLPRERISAFLTRFT